MEAEVWVEVGGKTAKRTPLFAVAAAGHADMVELLIAAGVDADGQGESERRPAVGELVFVLSKQSAGSEDEAAATRRWWKR